MNQIIKRVLCWPFCTILGIHLEGNTEIGMWGDANACTVCGADRFDLLVLRDVNDGWKWPGEQVVFMWLVARILPLLVITFIVIAAVKR